MHVDCHIHDQDYAFYLLCISGFIFAVCSESKECMCASLFVLFVFFKARDKGRVVLLFFLGDLFFNADFMHVSL